jgi:hypothetical protein
VWASRVLTFREMFRPFAFLVQIAVAVLFGLLFSGRAFGQTVPSGDASTRAQAAHQFAEGTTAFDRGDFVHAADSFEHAYRLVPHADSLWNAARARQRADDSPRAATLYARYLNEAPADATDRGAASALLASLAARLGRIEVHGSGIEDLVVDERRSEEHIIYVSPGAHVVRAVVDGALVSQTPALAAGDVVGLVFEAHARDRQAPTGARPNSPPPSDPQPPSRSRRHGLSPWFVTGGGALTGVAVAATVVSGLSTLSALHRFDVAPTESNLAMGQSMQARTNVLLGVSIGLGVMTSATAVWLVDWGGAAQSGVRVGLGVSRVEAEWRF